MTLHDLTVQVLTTSDFSDLQLLEEGNDNDMQDIKPKKSKKLRQVKDKFNDSGCLTSSQVYRYRRDILKEYKRNSKGIPVEQCLDPLLFNTFCKFIKENNLSVLQIRQILEQEVHANKKDTRLEVLKRLITEITLNDLLNNTGELEDELDDLASMMES